MKKDSQEQLSFEDALFSLPTEDPVPTEIEPPTVYRTAKLPLRLSRRQQAQVLGLMTAQRRLYNAAIAYIRCPTGVPVLCCSLTNAEKNLKYYQETGKEVKGYQWRPDNFFSSFKAWDFLRALSKESPWDHRGLTLAKTPSPYGVSAKTASALSQEIRGLIKGHFTRSKKGEQSSVPVRCRSARDDKGWLWDVCADEIRWEKCRLKLGASTQYGGFFLTKLEARWHGKTFRAAQLSRDGAGQFWFHLSYALSLDKSPLAGSAGIDLGIKRAVTVATETGKSATISGLEIAGLKRERDRRFRGIQRARSRVHRGQIRQYLTAEQQATMQALEAKSPGAGTKYAWRMINAARQEQGLKPRSRRDFKLLKAQKKVAAVTARKLKYANHCITRKTVSWLEKQKCGTVFLGDVKSIPKGRKKGQARRLQSKRNAQWEFGAQEKMLEEKLQEIGGQKPILTPEHYTSQTCPNCGNRRKPKGRLYHCKACGWKGDRDAVGAANILTKGKQLTDAIKPRKPIPLVTSPAMPRSRGKGRKKRAD